MFWNLLITTPVSVLVGFNCLIFLFIMDHIALLWFIPNNYWLDAKHCDFYHVRSCMFLFSSVQLSRSVMFNSLRPHGMQHARLPCLSPTPRAYSNSRPSSQWCHLTISSSGVPFSSCLQSFPESGSFLMSQLFTSGGQSIGASPAASVLPMNIQDWFPLEWTGWISLQSKGLLRVFSSTTVQKYQFSGAQLFLWSNSHIHTWPLEKPS